MGDDVQAAEKEGRGTSLKLVLPFEDKVKQDALALRLNGQMLKGGRLTADDQRQIEYNLNARLTDHEFSTRLSPQVAFDRTMLVC